jgi:hypothetical protein
LLFVKATQHYSQLRCVKSCQESLADFVADDTAYGRATYGPNSTATGQYGTANGTHTGADSRVLVLR